MGLDLNKLEEEARRDDVPLMFDDGMAFLLAYLQNHPEAAPVAIYERIYDDTIHAWGSVQVN